MSDHSIEPGTAGELTTEHYGLLIEYTPPARESAFTEPLRRQVVVDELRRWIYEGQRRVEVIDMTPSGAFVGVGHHMDADTPVAVLRRVRKPRRKAWGAGALKPGDTWEALADSLYREETKR